MRLLCSTPSVYSCLEKWILVALYFFSQYNATAASFDPSAFFCRAFFPDIGEAQVPYQMA